MLSTSCASSTPAVMPAASAAAIVAASASYRFLRRSSPCALKFFSFNGSGCESATVICSTKSFTPGSSLSMLPTLPLLRTSSLAWSFTRP